MNQLKLKQKQKNDDNFDWIVEDLKSSEDEDSEDQMHNQIIEYQKQKLQEAYNRIHPYSTNLVLKKPNVAKIKKKRFIKAEKIKTSAMNSTDIRKLRNSLMYRKWVYYLDEIDPLRTFMQSGLRKESSKIYYSTMSKLSNFLFLIRSSIVQLLLVALCNNPQVQIFSLVVMEITLLSLTMKAYLQYRHFSTLWHLVILLARSVLFLSFMVYCFYLSFNTDRDPVPMFLQLYGLINVVVMILFEYILALCGIFFFSQRLWVMWKEYRLRKKLENKSTQLDKKMIQAGNGDIKDSVKKEILAEKQKGKFKKKHILSQGKGIKNKQNRVFLQNGVTGANGVIRSKATRKVVGNENDATREADNQPTRVRQRKNTKRLSFTQKRMKFFEDFRNQSKRKRDSAQYSSQSHLKNMTPPVASRLRLTPQPKMDEIKE